MAYPGPMKVVMGDVRTNGQGWQEASRDLGMMVQEVNNKVNQMQWTGAARQSFLSQWQPFQTELDKLKGEMEKLGGNLLKVVETLEAGEREIESGARTEPNWDEFDTFYRAPGGY